MKAIKQAIELIINEQFDVRVDAELTRSEPEFGDYASNVALRLSKQLSKNPRDIAQAIAEQLKNVPAVASAEVAGPGFINIKLHSQHLMQEVVDLKKSAERGIFGANKIGQGETVVCEFPSPNMAKPYSFGHIRPALQGYSIAQVMRLSGYTVITDNHVCDSGTPFGKWVVSYEMYSSPEQLEKNGIYELSRVYIKITKALKEEQEAAAEVHPIADQVQQWLKRLENGDKQAICYRDTFNKLSFDHMHQVMDRLGVSTEFEYGESFYVQRGQEITDELLEKDVAFDSKGAVVVSLDEFDINTPIMLRKSNGTALYATTDLATVEFREKNWQPSKVFIHTGQEQAFYFRQLKALSQKAGYKDVINHLWHGLIDQIDEETGERSKMSSRKGVVILNDLLDIAEQKAAELSKDGTQEDIRAISLGAIKFAEFTADRKKGWLFDWETMFSTQGFSGPTVQYAAVRIASILQKAGSDSVPQLIDSHYDWVAEHQLLLELLAFPALIESLAETYELHQLAAYLYQLARTLNRYYETTPILTSDDDTRQHRLWLLSLTQEVFVTGLDVLGISVPSKM